RREKSSDRFTTEFVREPGRINHDAERSTMNDAPGLRIFLIIAAIGLGTVGLGYGVAPAVVMPRLLSITVDERDLIHVFRAVMGLYFAFAGFWLYAAGLPAWRRPAAASVVVLMTGLAAGRILSFAIDGPASPLLVAYLVIELVVAGAGAALLRRSTPLPTDPPTH
ncbi:MAG: DUF4345 domain-containing protein, partial [Planctomycetia bacterium]